MRFRGDCSPSGACAIGRGDEGGQEVYLVERKERRVDASTLQHALACVPGPPVVLEACTRSPPALHKACPRVVDYTAQLRPGTQARQQARPHDTRMQGATPSASSWVGAGAACVGCRTCQVDQRERPRVGRVGGEREHAVAAAGGGVHARHRSVATRAAGRPKRRKVCHAGHRNLQRIDAGEALARVRAGVRTTW